MDYKEDARKLIRYLEDRKDNTNIYLYVIQQDNYVSIYPLLSDIYISEFRRRYEVTPWASRKVKQFESFEKIFGEHPRCMYVGIEELSRPDASLTGWISRDNLHHLTWIEL